MDHFEESKTTLDPNMKHAKDYRIVVLDQAKGLSILAFGFHGNKPDANTKSASRRTVKWPISSLVHPKLVFGGMLLLLQKAEFNDHDY